MANLTSIAYIGNVLIHGWHGRLANLQYMTDDFARIGQTGSGAQLTGYRARRSNISAWAGAESRIGAITVADLLENMQGSVVVVSDDIGRVFQRVRIYEISTAIKAGFGPPLPSGSLMTYRIDIDAVLEALP